MRVIATAQGYDGIQIREPGDEFDMPEDSEASTWFKPVGRAEQAPAATKGKGKAPPPPPPEGDDPGPAA